MRYIASSATLWRPVCHATHGVLGPTAPKPIGAALNEDKLGAMESLGHEGGPAKDKLAQSEAHQKSPADYPPQRFFTVPRQSRSCAVKRD